MVPEELSAYLEESMQGSISGIPGSLGFVKEGYEDLIKYDPKYKENYKAWKDDIDLLEGKEKAIKKASEKRLSSILSGRISYYRRTKEKPSKEEKAYMLKLSARLEEINFTNGFYKYEVHRASK